MMNKARYMLELTYEPLFIPMLVLERRDLETGLPDGTYAQVSLALQRVLGEQAEVFKETLEDGSACLKFGLGLLHGSAWGRAISTILKYAGLRFV
jgi:hypothetical protein